MQGNTESNFNFELINNLSDFDKNVLSLKFDFILEFISNFKFNNELLLLLLASINSLI